MKHMHIILASAVALAALALSAGNVFYWHGGDTTWRQWSDSSFWSLEQSNKVNPDKLIPGKEDSLWRCGTWNGVYGKFDLGGEVREIAGFASGDAPTRGGSANWVNYTLYLTNGTLIVDNPTRIANNGKSFDVYSDAVVTLGGNEAGISYPSGFSGMTEKWKIRNGGRMNVLTSDIRLVCVTVEVDAGGTFYFDPDYFCIHNDCSGASTFSNSGIFMAPRGIRWNGADPWGSKKKLTVTQSAGTMYLGGDFTKTTKDDNAAPLVFRLAGGTLVASNAVAFVDNARNEVSASMTGSATVETAEDAVLDMSLFTYSDGVTLTKTGAGLLIIRSRPSTLSVAAGTVRFDEATDGTGVTLAPGTAVVFGAQDNVLAAPDDWTGMSFGVVGEAFPAGAVVMTSEDADFMAYVADAVNASGTVAADFKAQVKDGAVRIVPDQDVFECEGELDLGDPSGWGGKVPAAGGKVYVNGSKTVALVSSSSPVFGRIIVAGGATLKVVSTEIALPPVTLSYDAKLLVPGGVTADLSAGLAAEADETHLPVFEIATNGIVNVANGTVLKNLNLLLCGKIAVPDVTGEPKTFEGIAFGGAAAGETAYFGMTAVGGRIRVYGTQGVNNWDNPDPGWRRFVVPEDGGCVKVVGDILLKDVVFETPEGKAIYNSASVGNRNPASETFRFILDNTKLPLCRFNGIGGGAHVVCRNGGELVRKDKHPGVFCDLKFTGLCNVEAVDSDSGIRYPYSDSYVFSFAPDANSETLTLRDGGWIAVHRTSGNGKGTLVSSNGVWRIPRQPYVDGAPYPPEGDPWRWMSDIFTGLRDVRIDVGSALFLQSSSDLEGTEWPRFIRIANVPITGAGDLVLTNGVAGRPLSVMMVSGANTATGRLAVAPSDDPTTFYFNNGANWAGTVAGGSGVVLTNATDAAAPATVAFGALELVGRMTVRVWPQAGVNDTINLGGAISGTGMLVPVNAEGGRLPAGTSFVLGTYPADLPLPDVALLKKGWKVSSEPSAEQGKVDLRLTYEPSGLAVIVR